MTLPSYAIFYTLSLQSSTIAIRIINANISKKAGSITLNLRLKLVNTQKFYGYGGTYGFTVKLTINLFNFQMKSPSYWFTVYI